MTEVLPNTLTALSADHTEMAFSGGERHQGVGDTTIKNDTFWDGYARLRKDKDAFFVPDLLQEEDQLWIANL